MSAKKETEEGWNEWVYKPAPIITIKSQQRTEVIKWLKERGAVKSPKLDVHRADERARALGEWRDKWKIGGEPFYIHRDRVHSEMRPTYRIQVICKPEHAEELLAAGIIKNIPEYK